MAEDSHYFDEEPDPHLSEKPVFDSDPHQSEKPDPDPNVEVIYKNLFPKHLF